jgi:SAM-dependent methyltransferase
MSGVATVLRDRLRTSHVDRLEADPTSNDRQDAARRSSTPSAQTEGNSPKSGPTQDVETLRRQYSAMLDGFDLRPATRTWVGSLFDRGLRLADEIEARFGPLAGKRVLEIGSAYAGDLVALHARGAESVATDKFDFHYPTFHRCMPALGRFSIARCDAMGRWPFADGSFDMVLAMEIVEMVEDLDGFFAEIARVLRPGGFALLNTGVALKGLRRDPIYGLPIIAALPNRLRRFVAERIFGRGSDFRLSNHNFNSAGKFARHARPLGFDVLPVKFAGSPLMSRLARWPGARIWQNLVRYYAFDFVFIVPA